MIESLISGIVIGIVTGLFTGYFTSYWVDRHYEFKAATTRASYFLRQYRLIADGTVAVEGTVWPLGDGGAVSTVDAVAVDFAPR